MKQIDEGSRQMKDCQIELTALGSITQLPDSQKIFGAVVYLFAEKYGDEQATALVQGILQHRIHCMVSNMMPCGYLPAPQDYFLQQMDEKKESKDLGAGNSVQNRKLKYKSIKDRSYVTYEGLKRALAGTADMEKLLPYIRVDIRQQLRASIDSVRYQMPVLDSRLYSVPTICLSEVTSDGAKGKSVNRFSIYLQTNDSEEGKKLLEMLTQVVEEKEMIKLGKRVSQGMNLFQFEKMTVKEVALKKGVRYLNMGMLLPKNVDFNRSILKLFTSERRPYEKKGGWQGNFDRQYISFIDEGSIVASQKDAGSLGQSIPSPFYKARDIVFGHSYLWPIAEERQRV